ncbi:hypothetical protein EJ05DRAFT_501700 [Pseudovirgaria hyperparasitica]|uniref:PH domain-containing protein n=1 Tax=Pseudovirgaria hyperparasitica TaxID=470096 RepID=A0A6A6W7W7_9PEZI|nr:uncharacterized protein EJ05DRAFT_501700 [Pseudovirgaria hyperparasitica]KAF2757171.1 hypothetical protein EJ05DRAFT_501700 [Pseudovirgaria hyperparasitica]
MSPEGVSPVPQPTSAPSRPGKSATIEQSVKMFRVFEALRNGDTAAISKAVRDQSGGLEGTSILHLAVQCADLRVVEFVLSNITAGEGNGLDINSRDRDGNTPLHIAASLGRFPVVKMLLARDEEINDSVTNFNGQTPLDVARGADVHQLLQEKRFDFIQECITHIHELVVKKNYDELKRVLVDAKVKSVLDVNQPDLATDHTTLESGGTLLHQGARGKDATLIQLLLLNGADPFRRDRKGKLPQDVTKDDKTKALLKKSPAAAAAQRGIQEKTILGGAASQPGADGTLGSKEAREMKGYLKKWTNYTSGYKLRWFVLEDGVLSYYKRQEDAGSACRGAINMRIAKLYMDPKDKQLFEIQGKSSVKYHLKANHEVEAKRWFWSLNNAIQWSKDEAKEDERRQKTDFESTRHSTSERKQAKDTDAASITSSKAGGHLHPSSALGPTASISRTVSEAHEEEGSAYAPSMSELGKLVSHAGTNTVDEDPDDEDEYFDDASSHEPQPANKDAFNTTAQSAKLQLELLAQVSHALHMERERNPSLQLADAVATQALSSYEAAVGTLKALLGDLLRISRDRDAYWQYRLDREANVRRMWEESMAQVAKEQEQLEERIGESEEKRRQTKRALREALGGMDNAAGAAGAEDAQPDAGAPGAKSAEPELTLPRRKTTLVDPAIIDSDSEDDEEFFDAVGAGEVEVIEEMPVTSPGLKEFETAPSTDMTLGDKAAEISTAFAGYEDGPRKRLKMDADDRPKISLWGILKSMIGKDMTKMTLPVSFNEPTSLLQRVAEDMEYTDLLDQAADRMDSTERMVYVAAFAASEYASTIGRVAKPFNPLLGETYEYARPDKGYRFFIEQVSHHPPIGAAYAEAPKWDYYGESAVKSKFYGKSFDINPLGTWFLRLRPTSGGSELYTWKKVTSSVIGIITGNPTVDNYGVMEVKNHATGEVCTLEFKPRGWKASSAYQVNGKVLDGNGQTRWSVGGHWNDKIYARLTPGFEDAAVGANAKTNQAVLIWECHARPKGIPFNLTPFGVTLNEINDKLRPVLAPTDTRLRPDQRAMEDGEYDFAASEKNRVEEKQRAKRREREANGEEFVPRWFHKATDEATGEEFWQFNHEYWKERDAVAKGTKEWSGLEDIF